MKGIRIWFKALPPTTQLVVGIATILICYLMYKRITGFFESLGMGSKEKGTIDGLKAQGIKASYSKQQFQMMANNLYKAMKGVNFNINKRNNIVYTTFRKMNNELDVAMLEQAFGTRDNADLQTWLLDETFLDVGVINNHFASKGIQKSY